MKETERIADQLQRAFTGEAWHGPALLEILPGISAQEAAAHPIVGRHSIWELVLHIEAWTRAVARRLHGDPARLTGSENFPPVTNIDEHTWEQARNSALQAYEELSAAVLQLDDSRLEQPIIEGMSSVYINLHGAIQHSLYHAGQIAILKNAAAERQTT